MCKGWDSSKVKRGSSQILLRVFCEIVLNKEFKRFILEVRLAEA